VAGLRGLEPPNVSLTKCLAHQQNLAALLELFKARSEIASAITPEGSDDRPRIPTFHLPRVFAIVGGRAHAVAELKNLFSSEHCLIVAHSI
jgi:hypothetical protein